MSIYSYEEALADFETAQKNLRGNLLIDYKQLGLQYKLYSCEVRAVAWVRGDRDRSSQMAYAIGLYVSDHVQHGLRLRSVGS